LQRRPPVAVQAQGRVIGAVPAVAVGTVVVEAAVRQGAVDAEDMVGPLLDAAGVVLAMRADGAGAYVAPFFRSSRPVC
jgi:hypothetical protein